MTAWRTRGWRGSCQLSPCWRTPPSSGPTASPQEVHSCICCFQWCRNILQNALSLCCKCASKYEQAGCGGAGTHRPHTAWCQQLRCVLPILHARPAPCNVAVPQSCSTVCYMSRPLYLYCGPRDVGTLSCRQLHDCLCLHCSLTLLQPCKLSCQQWYCRSLHCARRSATAEGVPGPGRAVPHPHEDDPGPHLQPHRSDPHCFAHHFVPCQAWRVNIVSTAIRYVQTHSPLQVGSRRICNIAVKPSVCEKH